MLSPSTRSPLTHAELEESLEEVHGRASSVKSLGKMSAAVVDNVECKAAHGDLSTHNASSADAPKIFDRYEIHRKKLGQGGFGAVYRCVNKDTKAEFACKSVVLTRISSQELQSLHLEIAIMKRVAHPGIIRLEEVFYGTSVVYMVMELCEVILFFGTLLR